MFTLVSARFNDETWCENLEARERKQKKCLYGSPQEMSPKIEYNSPVFVVEMNNSKNQIEGIGLIKNKPDLEKYYRIHSDGNYNRYVYIGNYHIQRNELLEYNESLVNALDYILFKGKSHLKRGAGFTTIPEKLMKNDICKDINIKKEIKQLFVYHFREKLKQSTYLSPK
jgi:hypothetical protein